MDLQKQLALDLSPKKACSVPQIIRKFRPPGPRAPCQRQGINLYAPNSQYPQNQGQQEADSKSTGGPGSKAREVGGIQPPDDTTPTGRIPETLSPTICLAFCNPSDRETTEAAPLRTRTRPQAVDCGWCSSNQRDQEGRIPPPFHVSTRRRTIVRSCPGDLDFY